MNNTLRLLVPVSAATVLGLTLAGCTINLNVPPVDGQQRSMSGGMMSDEQNSSGFSQRDLMFAQMMIPHHQQAVDMSALAESKTSNPELLALSQQISDAQSREITQMQSWLDDSGISNGSSSGMNGMDRENMPGGMGDMGDMGDMGGMNGMGMLSDAQMTALENATGAEFEKLYLEGMIEHHEGALHMIHMISDSQNAEVKKLHDDIKRTQTEEIEQMKSMLAAMN